MKYIAYYRVSTKQQGSSGLGLNAQKTAVLSYIKHNGNKIIAEFTEQESGKNDRRPELQNAIDVSKQYDATLVIARLDRLSRNITFITSLMDSKVKFVCVDMPDATELTIHIFAALAQWERKRISERTSAALQELKRKGVKLGTPENFTDAGRQKAHDTVSRNAREDKNTRHAYHFIQRCRNKGMTWLAIADALNKEDYKTRTNKLFHPWQAWSIYKRFECSPETSNEF